MRSDLSGFRNRTTKLLARPLVLRISLNYGKDFDPPLGMGDIEVWIPLIEWRAKDD